MSSILITAFEPFGGKRGNASSAVLEQLPEKIAGYAAEKMLLPVVFGQAAEKALSVPADAVFLLGEAAGRSTVTPELRGRNLREARIPDNAGQMPAGEKILSDGPEEVFCRFPVRKIVERMQADGYGIAVSEDAGSFVCNDTFYLVGYRSIVPVSFIHVPAEPEREAEFADVMKRYIECCLASVKGKE